jgi:ribosomal protein RSM22 (predicted rRNA methylase)
MERETEERFQRIERNLEILTERVNTIAEGHIELEAAQKSTQRTLERFIDESRKRGGEVDERIANLTILVDRLIERDMGRQG